MEIRIDYTNAKTKEEAYNAVKGAITPELLAKWQVKAQLEYKDDLIQASGSGFNLAVHFKEDHCIITIKLNFLLKPLQKKIAQGIEKQFQRVI